MSKLQQKELEELRERVKILEEENSYLSDNKEELLLLGFVSEQVELAEDEYQILSAVLEKISILKDIPFCAVFSTVSNSARLIGSYSALQKTDISDQQIDISGKLSEIIKNGATILDLDKTQDFFLIKNTEVPFNPKAAVIVPFNSRYVPDGLFLFLFDQQGYREISPQVLLLQRLVEMTVSKIEIVTLVRELKTVNLELDKKIREKTAEVLETNESLKIQIEEQKQLKAQFYQAQKMEAIGKLAGGIAHDFNNLLTVINGYSELLLKKSEVTDQSYSVIQQINMAGKRAANLTNQLLAFSRKQVIRPVIVNLNDIVSDSEKMLQRLIGEDVFLQTILDTELGTLKADRGQMEQIIMNLVVNARDAMPTGGTIVIRTERITVADEELLPEYEVEPGVYCRLTISDDGSGMNEQTIARVFEPFFTTKGKGEGTGLGLSTVFGIVKQNKGFIKVCSAPDQGTTFRIHLPSTDGVIASGGSQEPVLQKIKNTETILIVEDDPNVLELTVSILKQAGYKILTTHAAGNALKIVEANCDKIDLLLTDVIMPGLSGNELAQKAVKILPELNVLFMSGYTDDRIAKHGILTDEVNYLQKPFTSHLLLKRVREILDG